MRTRREEGVMSEQAAREAVERLKSDEAFRERLNAMDERADRIAALQAEGYDCTAEELAQAAGRVEDSDREAVAGGSGGGFYITGCGI